MHACVAKAHGTRHNVGTWKPLPDTKTFLFLTCPKTGDSMYMPANEASLAK